MRNHASKSWEKVTKRIRNDVSPQNCFESELVAQAILYPGSNGTTFYFIALEINFPRFQIVVEFLPSIRTIHISQFYYITSSKRVHVPFLSLLIEPTTFDPRNNNIQTRKGERRKKCETSIKTVS